MTRLLPLRLALSAALSLAAFAPFARAQEAAPTPTPEPTYQYLVEATPAPEATPTPEATLQPTQAPEITSTPTPTPQTAGSNTSITSATTSDTSIGVSIGVNDTSDDYDDMVERGDSVHCLARLTTPQEVDITVVLANPDDHLRFYGSSGIQKQLTLLLPKEGTTVGFSVQGVSGTEKKDTAFITAHRNSAYTAKIGVEAMSVYYFESPKVSVVRGGNYYFGAFPGLGDHVYSARPAVFMNARVNLIPSDLDARAPQIRSLRVGLVQNCLSSAKRETIKNPRLVSNPSGSPVSISSSKTAESIISSTVLDTQDYAREFDTFLYDPNSVTFPGVTSTSDDSPNFGISYVYRTTSGTVVEYGSKRVLIQSSFLTYAFLLRIENGSVKAARPLRQTPWRLNLDSAETSQYAQVSTSDSTVQTTPKLQGPVANVAPVTITDSVEQTDLGQ